MTLVGAGLGGGIQYQSVAALAQQVCQSSARGQGMLCHLQCIGQWHGTIDTSQPGSKTLLDGWHGAVIHSSRSRQTRKQIRPL